MIKINGFYYRKDVFPCGEMHLRGITNNNKRLLFLGDSTIIEIEFYFENELEILELIFINDYLKSKYPNYDIHLKMPYVPYSRQDRDFKEECFTLKSFCKLINNCNFDSVEILDPHSDVTTALLDRVRVTDNRAHMIEFIDDHFKGAFHILSPDAGSLKKCEGIAKFLIENNKPLKTLIQCSKNRCLKTGDILNTNIMNIPDKNSDLPILIIDDICEGGRTFIEIAKILKKQNNKRIIALYVSHGFFTKGLEVFEGLIDIIVSKGLKKNDN